MRLVVYRQGNPFTELVGEDEAVSVGSATANRLVLPDTRIPAHVAQIFLEHHEMWVIEPLDERFELLLNGVALAARTPLRSGDQIGVLDFTIEAQFEPPRRPAEAPRATTSVASMTQFVKFQLPQGSLIRKAEETLTIQPAQIARIGRVNLALASCETVEALMDIALTAVFDFFGAHRAWIGIRRVNYGPMEYVEGRVAGGQSTDLPELGENLKPRALDRMQYVLLPLVSPEERHSVMAGPLIGPDGPLGMIYIDTQGSERRYDVTEVDFFITTLNCIGVQLDAIFKSIAKTRAATLDGEVTVAHAIQARLTPRKLPQWDKLQFGAFREPGRERTGDCYDVVKLAQHTAGVMIGHTEARGPLPGMTMSQAQASFRCSVMHNDPPHIFLRSTNVLLYDGIADHGLDCFMAIVDPESGQMHFAAAGRIGAYIIGARGDERRLVDPAATPALGMAKSVNVATLTEQLEPAETLVLFTPGVVTAKNRKDEVFGEERFVNILCDGFGQLASNMLKEMLSDLKQFTEGGSQPEDITVILAHRVSE